MKQARHGARSFLAAATLELNRMSTLFGDTANILSRLGSAAVSCRGHSHDIATREWQVDEDSLTDCADPLVLYCACIAPGSSRKEIL